jgi:hypothetical protein
LFGILDFSHCDLPFDLAQGGGESFDLAQDREPVERLVEPFGICYLKIFTTETRKVIRGRPFFLTTYCQKKRPKGLKRHI